MAEEVKVEIGVMLNIGHYSSVKLLVGLSEMHEEGDKLEHTAKLYDRLEKLMFRKLERLKKRTTDRLFTGE